MNHSPTSKKGASTHESGSNSSLVLQFSILSVVEFTSTHVNRLRGRKIAGIKHLLKLRFRAKVLVKSWGPKTDSGESVGESRFGPSD